VTGAPTATASPSRGRIIGVRAFLVLGVLLTVVSILSTYVKREALAWVSSSRPRATR